MKLNIWFIIIIGSIIVILISFTKKRSCPPSQYPAYMHRLIRQSAKYAMMAEQDRSPLMALIHSNYAMAYLMAIKDMAESNDLKYITKIDMVVYTSRILKIQENATRLLSNRCPKSKKGLSQYLRDISMYQKIDL